MHPLVPPLRPPASASSSTPSPRSMGQAVVRRRLPDVALPGRDPSPRRHLDSSPDCPPDSIPMPPFRAVGGFSPIRFVEPPYPTPPNYWPPYALPYYCQVLVPTPPPPPLPPSRPPLPPPTVQIQPLPQPILTKPISAHRSLTSSPVHPLEMAIPAPVYFRDPATGEFGLRCVCGEARVDGTLVQCETCEFWLHSTCVNIARDSKFDRYCCPFCLGKKISCVCKDANKYSEPLIQCEKCKLWSHKVCEKLDFGRNPEHFICHACDPVEHRKYPLQPVWFDASDTRIPDTIVTVSADSVDLISQIPEGALRSAVGCDLEARELSLRGTLEKYFREFVGVLFDRSHEFWRMFVDALCGLLTIERATVLRAMDTLATKLLYSMFHARVLPTVVAGHSESITQFLATESMPRLERAPISVALFVHPTDCGVCTPVALDDGAYIADLPGFIEHTDEVRSEGGLPRTCLVVTDTDIVVDMEGTPFTLARHIRRSFHFNCIVRLVRVTGEVRVALYATRTKGPLGDEKSRRGVAIAEGGELLLPFDGEIPFPIERVEWKEKKRHTRRQVQPHVQPRQRVEDGRKRQTRQGRVRQTEEETVGLTLLSGFLCEEIPALPIVLLPDRSAVARYNAQMEQQERIRSRKGKGD